MLEAEKYWCENCCNWDKEQVQMDGYANCKLTGTLAYSQESGKECKCFNMPAENVIVPPCKVGDKVYAVDRKTELWWQGKVITIYFTKFYTGGYDLRYKIGFDDGEIVEYDSFDVFPTKEEAEQALKGGAE